MDTPNFVSGNQGLDFNTAIESVIRRSCIIDFGIIQSVPATGIVEVAVAVKRTKQSMMYLTCVLANMAGASFAVNVIPKPGDRVLVVYPKLYDRKMFTITGNETQDKETILNENADGYNAMSGIALLCNQFKVGKHTNYITVDNGAITIKNSKATVTVADNGNITIDTQGKYTIKNNVTDLKDVLDGLASTVSGLTTEGTAVAQSASQATQTAVANWKLNKLSTLFT